MPCIHRFLGKYIDNSLFPNWDYDYLFIGTFNPGWTFEKGQNAKYFYGRTRNNYFWDLVPEIWDGVKMRKMDFKRWEDFLKKNRIGVTDIIKKIIDADYTNSIHVEKLFKKTDTGLVTFKKICWNTDEIITRIISKEKLKAIFFTNQKSPDIIEAEIREIEQVAIQNKIPFVRLVTPSSGARFRFPKGAKLYPTLFSEWQRAINPFR